VKGRETGIKPLEIKLIFTRTLPAAGGPRLRKGGSGEIKRSMLRNLLGLLEDAGRRNRRTRNQGRGTKRKGEGIQNSANFLRSPLRWRSPPQPRQCLQQNLKPSAGRKGQEVVKGRFPLQCDAGGSQDWEKKEEEI